MCRLLAVLLVLHTCVGCATGALRNAGRRTERAVHFDAAYTDGTRLWSVYRAELRNAEGELVATVERAALVRIADLDPAEGHPVDALPLERLDPEQVPRPDLVEVPLVRMPLATARPPESVVVVSRDGVDVGLRTDGLPGAAPGAHLDAGALIDRRIAGWTLPIFPLALAWDVVAIPVLAVLAVPYFGGSK